jgi:hypothetical protein
MHALTYTIRYCQLEANTGAGPTIETEINPDLGGTTFSVVVVAPMT